MNNKLYVGNLSFKLTEDELKELFSSAGEVLSVKMPTDQYSGQKRGFGFVEFGSESEAEAAMKAFNGQNVGGREIVVSVARPQEQKNGRPRR